MAARLGLDLDSTITAAPAQLATLAKAVKDGGGSVYIIHGAADGLSAKQNKALAAAKLTVAGFDGLYDDIDTVPKPYAKNKAAAARKRRLDLFVDNRKKNAKKVAKAGIPAAHFLDQQ